MELVYTISHTKKDKSTGMSSPRFDTEDGEKGSGALKAWIAFCIDSQNSASNASSAMNQGPLRVDY